MAVLSFDELVKAIETKGRPFHLLLGNGFSVSYDPQIFSYLALYDFVTQSKDERVTKLFDVVKTKNFEVLMEHLENFAALVDLFGGGEALKVDILAAADLLKTRLLDAINALHPEHVFTIPEERLTACANFLNLFLGRGAHIFSTNYDLLLYWVLMRAKIPNAVDGFGRERLSDGDRDTGEDPEYSELVWGKNKDRQSVHYLHGALPLFDTGVDVVKEEYEVGANLLEKIQSRIENRQYPIFVAAGNGEEKLTHILHNHYLAHCYDVLREIEGSVVSFGFQFGDSDRHIIDALNSATKNGAKIKERLWSIYIGVYSEADIAHVERIEGLFKCKVQMWDVKTAKIWG